jgi:hypothetical protein
MINLNNKLYKVEITIKHFIVVSAADEAEAKQVAEEYYEDFPPVEENTNVSRLTDLSQIPPNAEIYPDDYPYMSAIIRFAATTVFIIY